MSGLLVAEFNVVSPRAPPLYVYRTKLAALYVLSCVELAKRWNAPPATWYSLGMSYNILPVSKGGNVAGSPEQALSCARDCVPLPGTTLPVIPIVFGLLSCTIPFKGVYTPLQIAPTATSRYLTLEK